MYTRPLGMLSCVIVVLSAHETMHDVKFNQLAVMFDVCYIQLVSTITEEFFVGEHAVSSTHTLLASENLLICLCRDS